MSKYDFVPGMGEISGFGGGYEEACRKMLKAGLEWCDAHPEAKPEFHGFKNIYGIIMEDNDDAKALSKAVLDGSGGDATGAMHQAVIGHIFAIRKHGWDYYVKKMSEPTNPKRCQRKMADHYPEPRGERLPETPAPFVDAEIIDSKPDLSKPVIAPWVTVLTRTLPTNANETELRDCPPEFMVDLKVPSEWLGRAKRLATPPKADPYAGSWKAYETNRKKEWVIRVRFGNGDIDLILEHKAT